MDARNTTKKIKGQQKKFAALFSSGRTSRWKRLFLSILISALAQRFWPNQETVSTLTFTLKLGLKIFPVPEDKEGS